MVMLPMVKEKLTQQKCLTRNILSNFKNKHIAHKVNPETHLLQHIFFSITFSLYGQNIHILFRFSCLSLFLSRSLFSFHLICLLHSHIGCVGIKVFTVNKNSEGHSKICRWREQKEKEVEEDIDDKKNHIQIIWVYLNM